MLRNFDYFYSFVSPKIVSPKVRGIDLKIFVFCVSLINMISLCGPTLL